MNKKIMVRCLNLDSDLPVNGGETLYDVAERIKDRLGFSPIVARVNNKLEPLQFPVYRPREVEFLSVDTPPGHRTYTRSLCMLLYKAVVDCYPRTRLRIEHSIARGYYCRLFKGQEVTKGVVDVLKNRMKALVASNLPFEKFECPRPEATAIFRAEGLNDKVRLLSTIDDLYVDYYKLEETADNYYGPLAHHTGQIPVFDLHPYKEGFLLMGRDPEHPEQPCRPVTQEKMYNAFTDYLRLNQTLGVRNVGELNKAVGRGESSMLINVAEAMHVKCIDTIAADIARRFAEGGAKLVMVAGPSSSGKTTFAKRLEVQLMTYQLHPKTISLDNYFVDRCRTPRDTTGDFDYESLYALDLQLFNDHLNRLIRGEEVELPYYNFERGESGTRGERLRLEDNSILLIEGIHGLNPELTSQVEERMKYRIYVSALTTLAIDDHNWVPTTDNRLLRRIVRDYQYRGVSALESIRRWQSVRRGEERWIFPFQENADAMFNSSLLFELAVIKDFALHVLSEVPRSCVEYAEADRLRRFLSYFRSIDQKAIPPTSLLREFLGGSSFHY